MYRSRLFWCWIAVVAAFLIPVRIAPPAEQAAVHAPTDSAPPTAVAGPGPEGAARPLRPAVEPPDPPQAFEPVGPLPRPGDGRTTATPRDDGSDDERGGADDTPKRTVLVPSLPVRSGPSPFHPEIAVLHGGDLVTVLYPYDGHWLKVRSQKGGIEGYIERGTLSLIVSP